MISLFSVCLLNLFWHLIHLLILLLYLYLISILCKFFHSMKNFEILSPFSFFFFSKTGLLWFSFYNLHSFFPSFFPVFVPLYYHGWYFTLLHLYYTWCISYFLCSDIHLSQFSWTPFTIYLRFFFPTLLSFSLSTSLLAWVYGEWRRSQHLASTLWNTCLRNLSSSFSSEILYHGLVYPNGFLNFALFLGKQDLQSSCPWM